MEVDMLLKMLLAAVLGGIIGLEREISHKEAGLRTNILIAIGSALVTILSLKFAQIGKGGDPARLAAQIVTGIGFLGAGAIIQARLAIHGLTTAATIWTVAAIGIAVGSGYYLFSFLVTLLVVIVLTLFKYISQLIEEQHRMYAYVISTDDNVALLREIKHILTELSIRPSTTKLSKGGRSGFEIEIVLHTSENKNREFLEKVTQLQGVREMLSEGL